MDSLLDPLFRIPLLTGLVASLLLPLLGALLHAREEWLAALGIAHVAAAAQLAGAALGLPLTVSGALGAVIAVAAKQLVSQQGNLGYALLMFAGWAVLYLVAANSTLGESLAHAMSEGQIFLVGKEQLYLLLAAGLPFALALPWLAQRLLRARFFPGFERANALPAWRWHLGFDLLAAVLLAFGTASLGLMATFALVVLPAWSVFMWVHSWRLALLASAAIGTGSYLAAFALALHFDQPFAPVQVAVLLSLAVLLRGSHALLHR